MALDPEVVNELMGRLGPNTSLSAKETVAPSPEMIEMLRSRQKEQDRNMLLAGASGALGEFLFGGAGQIAGAGAEMAGQFMKRKHSLEDQETKGLMAQLKARSTASDTPKKGTFQQMAYQDDKGNIKIGKFDTRTGEQHFGKTLKGLAPAIMKSEGTGEILRMGRSKAGDEARIVKEEGSKLQELGVTPKFKQFTESRLPKVEAKFKDDNNSLKQTALAAKNIAERGSFPNIQALKSLIKTTDPRISNEDFLIARDNLSWVQSQTEKAKQLGRKTFEPRIRGEVIKVLKNTYDVLMDSIDKSMDKEISSQTFSPDEYKYYKKRMRSALPTYTLPEGFGEMRTKIIDGKPVQFFFDGEKFQEL